MPETTPVARLHRLLVELFPGDRFRSWVSRGPDGPRLVAQFPGSTSTAEMIDGAIEVLRAQAYLDDAFFARLIDDFPRRREQIRGVAADWGAPAEAPARRVRPLQHLRPFPGREGPAFPADHARAELDVFGERRGDVLHLAFCLHNDSAVVLREARGGLDRLLAQVHGRGAAFDGPRALDLGQRMAALLFGRPGEPGYHQLFRALFRQREDAAPRVCASRHPVRCRLHLHEPELRALPWTLLAEDGRWLVDDGWLIELAAVEVAHNHDYVKLRGPCTTLLVIPAAAESDGFDPADHRERVRSALEQLWRPTVDAHRLPQYILSVSTWSEVQKLSPTAEVVYVCSRASEAGGAWHLVLDGPRRTRDRIELKGFLHALSQVKVTYLNLEIPDHGALVPALQRLPGPPCVIAPWFPELGPEAAAAGSRWLTALLGDDHDPASALHAVTREQPTARAGTMQALTRYRGWTTESAPREDFRGRARLHLDRKHQRWRFFDTLRTVAAHPVRRVEAVVIFGEAAHGIAAIPDLLAQHVDAECDVVRPAMFSAFRDRLPFPATRDNLEAGLHEVLCDTYRFPLGSSLQAAMTRYLAGQEVDRGARRILWLDWGVVGVDAPLKVGELLAWLRYHVKWLGPAFTGDDRIVATLCVAASADGCSKLRALLDGGVPDDIARAAGAGFSASPALDHVERKDVVEFLEKHSSCPEGLVGTVADALMESTNGEFEALVAALEAAENGTLSWREIAGASRPRRREFDHDEEL